MSDSASTLLKSRRFFPYFMTQFLGAFNDNVFKNTLLLFVAYASIETLPISSTLFINLAAGLFILPFFLFSASSGVLADQWEKSALIRKIKLLEIIIMGFGAIGFITESYLVLLLLLFLMGTQSALFGPVKYALLPQQLTSEQLLTGNALVGTGTFLAILLGTLLAGMIASAEQAKYIAAGAVTLFAILGYLASRYIPEAPPTAPRTVFKWQPIRQTRQTLSIANQDPTILITMMTISWFWFLGATYLTQFPNFTKTYLHGSESAVSWLLILFSVGIAMGSMLCDRVSRSRLELGIVPIASFGISVFGYGFSASIPAHLPPFDGLRDFLIAPQLWPLFFNLLCLGISGGLFIVPLYTLLQRRAHIEQRAQVIAALNIYNALLMVLSAITGIICLIVIQLTIPQLFRLLAIANGVVFLYLVWKTPIYTIRFLFTVLAKLAYNIRYQNLELIPKQGGALIVCNHVSYLDALLLLSATPRIVRFVMEADYIRFPIVRPILHRANVIPICASRYRTTRQAFQQIETALSQGDLVCIFPEGQLTSTGEMAPFMKGLDKILQQNPSVPVIPMALKGLWGSYFSRYRGRACRGFPRRFRAPITITAGTPINATEANTALLWQRVAELRGSRQ